MSDSPIQPQPNQTEQSLFANLSPFVSIGSRLISGGLQVWSSYIHQETQLKLADKAQETQLKLADKIQEVQLKLANIDRETQLKLVDKNQEIQLKLEYFKNELRRASELENFERQKELQLELAELIRETQLRVASQQRETALALPEVNKLFEHWPLRIVPSLILKPNVQNNRPPLKVIIAPPEINFDTGGNATQGLPKMENTLAQGLRQFFDRNYSQHSQIRPVEFLDGAWDSNKYHGGSSIKVLFEMLRSEPILILESEIEGDYLNFRIAYWSYGDTTYKYATALARLPYTNIIYESAKARAIKWKPARDILIQQGKNPKLINELDTHNLEILEEEEQLKSFGIDTSDLPCRYKVNNKDFDALCQFLITIHALFAGLTIDIHYLTHYDVTPLLPHLLPELVTEEKQIIGEIISSYQGIYQSLCNERSAWIPELFLDLANSLSHLIDKSWARETLNSSVRFWLSLRGITINSNDLFDLREITLSVLTSQDVKYLEKVKQCLAKLGDTQVIDVVINSWLNNSILIETLPGEIKLEFPSGITLELLKIPAGSFMMGSAYCDEEPQHRVNLKEFYLGKYPVTQEQYQAVMDDNPSSFQNNPKNPVERVNWNDAQVFCQKLKELTGKDFRLSTEAEWEYACRSGSQSSYYFGNDTNQLEEYAWYNKNSDSRTHPVGQKKPNDWGLYDMHGNVWEWCGDPWHDSYANKPIIIANHGNFIWSNNNNCRHILRGGSWNLDSTHCRSAYRLGHYTDSRNFNVGFRLALGLSSTLDS